MFQISRHCLPFAHQPLVSHMTLQLNIIFLFSKLKSRNQPVFAIKMELFSSPISSPLCPHLSPLCSPHRPCTLLQVTSHLCNLDLCCLLKTKRIRMKNHERVSFQNPTCILCFMFTNSFCCSMASPPYSSAGMVRVRIELSFKCGSNTGLD